MSDEKQPDAPRLMPADIVAVYDKVKEEQFDPHRRVWRNPTVLFNALHDLGRRTAERLHAGLKSHGDWILRVEARIKVLEDFKNQIEELNAQIEARMKEGDGEVVLMRPPSEKAPPKPATVIDAKPPKEPKKNGKQLAAVASSTPTPVAEVVEPAKEPM